MNVLSQLNLKDFLQIFQKLEARNLEKLVKLQLTVPWLKLSSFWIWNPWEIYKHFVQVGVFVPEEVGILHVSQLHLQDEALLYC